MSTIGVYDSGVGGLTTLKGVIRALPGNNIIYLADNLRCPLGALDEGSLLSAIESGISYLMQKADAVAIACNTASSLLSKLTDGDNLGCKSQKSAFILSNVVDKPSVKPIVGILPQLEPDCVTGMFSPRPEDILLMATDGTLSRINVPRGMKVASTPLLASLVEEALASGGDFKRVEEYLSESVSPFRGVKQVILGCTHYAFCKRQILDVLGRVTFRDGDAAMINALSRFVSPHAERAAKIEFVFTGENERAKYSRILEYLINGKRQI